MNISDGWRYLAPVQLCLVGFIVALDLLLLITNVSPKDHVNENRKTVYVFIFGSFFLWFSSLSRFLSESNLLNMVTFVVTFFFNSFWYLICLFRIEQVYRDKISDQFNNEMSHKKQIGPSQ